MKKLLITILLLCLLLPVGLASQWEEIDLSDCTDDEIMSLLEAVQTEITDRGMEKTAMVYSGEYRIGRDLPAGHYLIEVESGHAGSGYVTLRKYYPEEDDYHFEFADYVEEGRGYSKFVTLGENDWLWITEIPYVSMTISRGIVFQ